jgi:AhpD family alkylhydroperoxidase
VRPTTTVRTTSHPDDAALATTKGTYMEPRMNHPVAVVPGALEAVQGVSKVAAKAGVPPVTTMMVGLRASQINGCSFCVNMHAQELRDTGESEQRIATVAAWRDAPWFSDPERAALALTEALTRIADRPESLTDEIWADAAKHYDELQLGGLLLDIGAINVWNRLNAATRTLAGSW